MRAALITMVFANLAMLLINLSLAIWYPHDTSIFVACALVNAMAFAVSLGALEATR